MGFTQISNSRIQRAGQLKGFSLIEVMMAMGILGIMTLGFASLMAQNYGSQRGMQIRMTLMNLRNRIDSAIRNQQTWNSPGGAVDSTVEVNFSPVPGPNDPNFQSLIDTSILSPVSVAGGYPVSVLMGNVGVYSTDFLNNIDVLVDQNPNNNVIGTPATRGFDIYGNKCVTFGDPTSICVFQFQIFWTPICASGVQCLSPGVQYSVRLSVNQIADVIRKTPINPASYQIEWTTRNDPNYLANFCNNLLGTWDGTNCTFANTGSCAANERLIGIEVTGAPPNQVVTKKCEPILKGLDSTFSSAGCGPGTKMQGVDSSGSPICTANLNGANTTVCPVGEKVVQIDATGNRVCARNLAGANMDTCLPGERFIALDDKGGYTCVPMVANTCLGRTKMIGINTLDGMPVCRDPLEGGAPLNPCPAGKMMANLNTSGDFTCVPILSDVCPLGKQMTGINSLDGKPVCTYSVCPDGWIRTGSDIDGNPICEVDTQHNWNAFLAGSCNNCYADLAFTSCPILQPGETTTVTNMWFTYPAICDGISGFNSTCSYLPAPYLGTYCVLRQNGPAGVKAECHVDAAFFGNPAIDAAGVFQCHHRFTYL